MYKIIFIHPLYWESVTPIHSIYVNHLDTSQDNFIMVRAEDATPIHKKLAIPISNIKVIIEL